MTDDLSTPSLEMIEEQALTLLDLIHRRHSGSEDEHPHLITHVMYDLVEALREAGDVPVLLGQVGDHDYRGRYNGLCFDSVTKIETFSEITVETYGMEDDEGHELTPQGLAFEGLDAVVVMYT